MKLFELPRPLVHKSTSPQVHGALVACSGGLDQSISWIALPPIASRAAVPSLPLDTHMQLPYHLTVPSPTFLPVANAYRRLPINISNSSNISPLSADLNASTLSHLVHSAIFFFDFLVTHSAFAVFSPIPLHHLLFQSPTKLLLEADVINPARPACPKLDGEAQGSSPWGD